MGATKTGRSRRVALSAAVLLLSLGAAGLVRAAEPPAPATPACPPPETTATSPTPPAAPGTPGASPYRPAPTEVLACVAGSEISGASFAHWATVAERDEPPRRRTPNAEPTRVQMLQVMGFLVSSDWVIGEAADLHIVVSPAAVRRRFDRLRREQFHGRWQYGAFLKQTGETTADVMLRVRLSMISTLIQQHAVGHHRGARGQQEALARFVHGFQEEWKAQTYCESLYATQDCGHTAGTL